MIKKDNARITVVIPKELYKMISKDAGLEDRSVSNFVARILKREYKFKEDEKD